MFIFTCRDRGKAVRLAIAAFLGLQACHRSALQDAPASELPDLLRPSATETVRLTAYARGVQIYECKAEPSAAQGYAWQLVSPEAELRDEAGQTIGRHFAGPTWEATDGSQVVGAVKQKVDAPDGQGIAWLRLETKSTHGSGVLSAVTAIVRAHTVGGKAPSSGCSAAEKSATTKVDYRAIYYFYGPRS